MNKRNRNKLRDTENRLLVARWEGGCGEVGEKDKWIKKCKLAFTSQSQGCKVQPREYS